MGHMVFARDVGQIYAYDCAPFSNSCPIGVKVHKLSCYPKSYDISFKLSAILYYYIFNVEIDVPYEYIMWR